MKRRIGVLRICKELGKAFYCDKCRKWIIDFSSQDRYWIPEHVSTKNGTKKCRNSGCSAFKWKYVVKNKKQAQILARVIKHDDGHCLVFGHHTVACGDGWNCVETRIKLAKALAEYFLQASKSK